MKKSKISLSPLKLKKEAILILSKGKVYGGDINTANTCNPAGIPPNCALYRVCPTNDMADPKCFNNDTIKNTCQCPTESNPAIQCWDTSAACPVTSLC